MRFITNIQKLITSLLSCSILSLFAVLFLKNQFYILAVGCLIMAIIFILIFIANGSTIHIDEKQIERRTLFARRNSLTWEHIREVGIAGINVLRPSYGKYAGPKYIYFSTVEMTEDDRFNMCLKWPPKDIIYMKYSPARIQWIQRFWNKDPILYNTGTLTF